MAFVPYKKQTLDPRWQKKRLERLELAGWECECCGTGGDTLHVHHPRYKKGAMIWEYENEELQVLCHKCHSDHHNAAEFLAQVLASNSTHYSGLVGLIAGFLAASLDGDESIETEGCPDYQMMGAAAYMLMDCGPQLWEHLGNCIVEFRRGEVPFNPVERSMLLRMGAEVPDNA